MISAAFTLVIAIISAPPEAKARYYLGESKVTTVDGKVVGNLVTFLKRESYPVDSKVVETMLTISFDPREPSSEHVAVWSVTGQSFTMKEQRGGFTGGGKLTGRPWEWTEWTTTTKLSHGTIQEITRVTDRGLSASRVFVGPDGAPRFLYADEYASIDGGTYELFRSKLFGGNAK